jgi:hypothetical protein
MKNILFVILALLLAGKGAIAQCDKKMIAHSEKQEMLNEQGEMVDGKDDILDFEFTKEKITINRQGADQPMIATIKETTCEWKDAFKNGKSFFKVEYLYPNGQSGNGSFEVEGKEGKILLYVIMDRMPGRKIRVITTKFEEQK